MNCSKCSAPIDYRFSTVCPDCASDLPVSNPVTNDVEPLPLVAPNHDKLNFGQHVGNVTLVLMCSFASMVVGASAMFFIGGTIYRILITPGPYTCGQATALAYLSILIGGFLGCTGGTVFGYRNTMSTKRRFG
jgi:hypothetical protein